MVGRATGSVRLEQFLFGGPTADAIIDLLVRKIDDGVRVQITLDRARGMLPAVRRECAAAYRRLRAAGIDVVLSDTRPLPDAPGRPATLHNKILVVDDREALVGGTNVGTPFFRHHDVMIHLVGPAADALGRQFDFDRQFTLDRGRPRPEGSQALLPFSEMGAGSCAPGESWARVLGCGIGRRTTLPALVRNLRAARESVLVTISEIGRTGLIGELIAAKRRGIDVRVIVDPQDLQEYLPPALGPLRRRFPKGVLNANAVQELLAAGVAVRQFTVGGEFAILHMKMALFDAATAIVGSTNWTRGGFEWVNETDVELCGGTVIDTLRAGFSLDWERSTPALPPSRFIRFLCSVYERSVQ